MTGITPAHAGNTFRPFPVSLRKGDHPRACGEYVLLASHAAVIMGSPPRMRGIPMVEQRPVKASGITPAHAGNTDTARGSFSGNRDHPRACGEYLMIKDLAGSTLGSPPRMRGIPQEDVLRLTDIGITPAHAGNTPALPLGTIARWDHPRACGEYFGGTWQRLKDTGSPPRMRGIPKMEIKRLADRRITPAHAGNTMVNRRDDE